MIGRGLRHLGKAGNSCFSRGTKVHKRNHSTLKREWAKVKRGVQLLKDETMHSKDLMFRDGKLNEHDRHVVAKTAKDVARLVPVLAILALPGGSLLVPIVSKLAPCVLPSTFSYVENDPSESKSTPETVQFRSKVVHGLVDLEQRMSAQAMPDDGLLAQLRMVKEHPDDASKVVFAQLYTLSEDNIMDALDDETLRSTLDRLGGSVPQEASRDEVLNQLKHKISKIRAGDLALQDAIDSKAKQELMEVQDALKARGIALRPHQDALKVLQAWLDVTVIRSLPVTLALFAQGFDRET